MVEYHVERCTPPGVTWERLARVYCENVANNLVDRLVASTPRSAFRIVMVTQVMREIRLAYPMGG